MILIPSNVIQRYASRNGMDIMEANNIFKQLEIYLKTAKEKQKPSKIVDSAWHEFILHTLEYTDYCQKVFGSYVHHIPGEEETTGNELADCTNCRCSSGCDRRIAEEF
jgi:hypothetical protein